MHTNGSEYLAIRASGSRETGNPFLYAELHWYVGSKNETIGASACHEENIEIKSSSIHWCICKYALFYISGVNEDAECMYL